jgi:hypothetical protein
LKRQRVEVSQFPSLPGWKKKGGQAFCASPERASRGDRIRSGQEQQETQKVEKDSWPAGFAARKGFWLLLAHKSNKVNRINAEILCPV